MEENVENDENRRTEVPRSSSHGRLSRSTHWQTKGLHRTRPTHSAHRETRKTHYTLSGRLVIDADIPVRVLEPTYQLTSNNPFDVEHVNFLVRNCTLQNIENYFTSYKPVNATQFANELSHEIKLRLKLLHYDRYRIVVVTNVMEKRHQTVCWQIGFLWEHSCDLWTSFRHETPSFIFNVVVLGVYWN